MTLGYSEVVISLRKVRYWVGSAGLSQGLLRSPTETPQFRDTAAGPHRNPTGETAHSGTLVMRVKSTENSRSAAPMRVSWADGAFSRFQVSALGMTELLKSGRSTVQPSPRARTFRQPRKRF